MGSRWRLVVLAGLFTLVTACGGGGEEGGDGVASLSDKETSSSAAPKDDKPDIDKMREYASCMKKHGVEVTVEEDPSGEGGGMSMSIDGVDQEKVEKAEAECKKLLPNGGEPPKPSAEDLDEARKMAQCLREHGVDVPDPTMEDPGIRIDGDKAGDKETVDKAMEACAPEGTAISSGGGGE